MIAVQRSLIPFEDIKPNLKSTYLVKDWLGRSGMSGIIGPSNCGKSFFMLDLGFHVALNRPWFGRRVNGGPVVYIAAEGGNGIVNRIDALKRHYKIPDGQKVPFYLLPWAIDLCEDVDWLITSIMEATQEEPPALVIIDTLARSFGGMNENESGDMGDYIEACDRIREQTKANVSSVHHTGKDPLRGARGHSSFRAALDTEIELSCAKGVFLARVTKQKDMATEGEIAFRLQQIELGKDEDDDPVNSCVIVEENIPSRQAGSAISRAKAVALEALEDAIQHCGQIPPANSEIPPDTHCVYLSEWKEHCIEHGISSSKKSNSEQQAFKRALDSLCEDGLIGIHKNLVWPK